MWVGTSKEEKMTEGRYKVCKKREKNEGGLLFKFVDKRKLKKAPDLRLVYFK